MGSPQGAREIHHMADPAQVLVEDVGRIGQVDVGLLGAADAQHEAALGELIGLDHGMLAVVRRKRVAAGVPSALTACPGAWRAARRLLPGCRSSCRTRSGAGCASARPPRRGRTPAPGWRRRHQFREPPGEVHESEIPSGAVSTFTK